MGRERSRQSSISAARARRRIRVKSFDARLVACAVLATVLLAGGIGLWPEISISRVDLNDNVFHFALVQDMVDALEHGGNPLDFWAPEWSFGYPVLRTYQPLAHAVVVLVYFAFGKSVSLQTVFVWVRFLSVLLLPFTFFVTARLLALGWLEAAAASLLAPMVSTNFLYGLEYGSYIWSGSGLFTQAVAVHFLLLTIGAGFQGVRQGRRLGLAGMFMGLTFLSHFVYGYMGAMTICLLVIVPDANSARRLRILRAMWIGAIAFLLAAFELLPMMEDASFINHSRWEAGWKWDSFGAGRVLKLLFTGELLDHGRMAALSLLVLAGAGVLGMPLLSRASRSHECERGTQECVRHSHTRLHPTSAFIASGAGFWLMAFFGRTFWGSLLTLLAVPKDMPLHRVIGGLHIFLVFMAAIGLASLWRELALRRHFAAAVLATVALLYPMAAERARILANNAVWGRQNLAAYEANRKALDQTLAKVRRQPGRVYAGLAAGWGRNFTVGDVPVYGFLSTARIPAVGFLYHAMALTGDLMVRFNEWDPAQYRLFNIRSVVAPNQGVTLPPFLVPREQIGSFQIFDAPGAGYFDVVEAPIAVHVTRDSLYDVNDRWLSSDRVGKKQHLLLVFAGGAFEAPPLGPDHPGPAHSWAGFAGTVYRERQVGDRYEADLRAARSSFALFRMTWHPNWKAYVDGLPEATVMLSPGFVGVPLRAGRHTVMCRYEAGSAKFVLGLAGWLFAAVLSAIKPSWLRASCS
jgi:hypothetical protein